MHAHIQIEYTEHPSMVGFDHNVNNGHPYTRESLLGFNPNDAEDVKMAHNMLDEYLQYLRQMHKLHPQGWTGSDNNRFIMFDGMHDK